MKHLRLFFIAAMVAALGIFTGCEEEGEEEAPILSFFGGEYIDEDVTVEAGSTLRWHWQAQKGDNNLEKFEVLKDASYVQGFPNEDIDKDSYEDSLVIDAPMREGTYGYDFVVTDKAGNSEEKEFIVTVEKSANPIQSFTAILMGAQYNPDYESALDAYNNKVYFISGDEDKNNAADIDILYYYGSANSASLVAPDDETVTGGSGDFSWTSDWGTQNDTRFKVSDVTVSEFDDMGDDETIATLSGMDQSKLTQLSADDILAFQTADDKKGLVKVVDITTGDDGMIKIDVKIQE
jgi:hypothetical protein